MEGSSPDQSYVHQYILTLLLIIATTWLYAGDASAQMFSYDPDRPRAVQSLSFGYTLVDFQFDGDGVPTRSFAFEGPLYGAVYTRPNFHVAFAYGSDERTRAVNCEPGACVPQNVDLRMLDAVLTTWGEIRIAGDPGSGDRFFVPIALHSSYRRVAPEGAEDSLVDSFNITVIGLGTGVGFTKRLAEKVQLEGRATPIIGLALRAFGDSAGNSRLLDTHVQVHAVEIADRFGITAGYGFRAQLWDISASSLFPSTQNDLFDYTSTSHALSIGVNW